jgi:phospholipase C
MATKPPIEHIFVLMMENRSFDHLLGWEAVQGMDLTGRPLVAEGLAGNERNLDSSGSSVPVGKNAPDCLSFDPHHEFPDIRTQLCGPGGTYPNLTLEGFVKSNGPDVMKCFDRGRLNILPTLAREFALCDHWFSALPGPTWPNRLFAHAATSGGLFCSPDTDDTLDKSLFGRYEFENGTIYDALEKAGKSWRIYHDGIPQAITLAGMKSKYLFGNSFEEFGNFAKDLRSGYTPNFTFIEPHYGGIAAETYTEGNSQHPNGNIQAGEKLIRDVYLAIRNSPVWESSLLLITYDEHGGFYDHVQPLPAVPPGDLAKYAGENEKDLKFDFSLHGVRVPAVVVSPWVPKNIIDQSVYDHGSISKTAGQLLGFAPITHRDANSQSFDRLLSLGQARTDCLENLPDVVISEDTAVATRNAEAPGGLDKQLLYLGAGVEVHLDPHKKKEISRKVAAIKSRSDAGRYLKDLHQRVLTVRNDTAAGKIKHWLAIKLKDVWATFKGI